MFQTYVPLGCSFFFLVSLGGVRLSPLGTSATVGLLYQPRMIDEDYGEVSGMRIGRGNRSTRRKPATMSTTNTTWPDLGSNQGRRGGKPATNCLTYDTAPLGCTTLHLVDGYHCFGEICCFYFQNRRHISYYVSWRWKQSFLLNVGIWLPHYKVSHPRNL
jgi:hypothetical protein